MTIDDFDINEISDKLSIRDEDGDNRALEAAHDDGHNDFVTGCYHEDGSNAFTIGHDDVFNCTTHDDGHYDIFDDCCSCFSPPC